MRFKITFVIIGLLFACQKESFSKVKVIGHAGNGLTVPHSIYVDNSKESIQLALSHIGCDGVELDVQMDRDGKLWLFHDDNMARTTLKDGSIADYSTAELEKAHYSTLYKEKLVRFSPTILSLGMKQSFFFDLKVYNSTSGQNVDFSIYIQQLQEFIEGAQGFDYRFICKNRTFSELLLNNGLEVYFEANGESDIQYLLNNAGLFRGVFVKNALIYKDQVTALQSKGYEVLIFNLRSPKGTKEAIRKRPDYVVADNIKTALIEKK